MLYSRNGLDMSAAVPLVTDNLRRMQMCKRTDNHNQIQGKRKQLVSMFWLRSLAMVESSISKLKKLLTQFLTKHQVVNEKRSNVAFIGNYRLCIYGE